MIEATDFTLPDQVGPVYHGKVGDVYRIRQEPDDLLCVIRTDRISAYDVVLPRLVPHKGQVLNQVSAHFLEATADAVPNWFLASPDPNASVGYYAEPFKIEMIVRGALLGSAWRAYHEEGVRDLCGNLLPEGLKEFDLFDEPLVTPTTKADQGHDENITPEQIVEEGLATESEYRQLASMALRLFLRGQVMARERGLVLGDTKYEFGKLATGSIVAIDEINTPDSARYFFEDEYEAYLQGATNQRPEQLSKEFARERLAELGFTGQPGQAMPKLTHDFMHGISNQYVELYERMLRYSFKPATAGEHASRSEQIKANLIEYLETEPGLSS